MYPVVALASHDDLHVHAHVAQNITGVLIVLTVKSIVISLFVQVAAADHIHSGKPVRARTGDDEMLLEEPQRVVTVINAFRQAIDRHLDRALQQHLAERIAGRIEQLKLNAEVAFAEIAKEAGENLRTDGAHHADLQRNVVKLGKCLRGVLRSLCLSIDPLEVRLHQPSELGQVRALPLAMKQRAAELPFEVLDGASQTRLRNRALVRGAGEVQGFAEGKEVLDLVELHPAFRKPLIVLDLTFKHDHAYACNGRAQRQGN